MVINRDDIISSVKRESNNYTIILSETVLKSIKLFWGRNGLGDRWAYKIFNYTVIYGNGNTKLYSENIEDIVPKDMIDSFRQVNIGSGIIGIFVHSKRITNVKRPISKNILEKITTMSCVVCGTHKTICDHKNDLYNDMRVLDTKTQLIDDFQPLCNHCNLQKREVCKKEKETQRIYSAKKIKIYQVYPFEFPWEKKAFDEYDINCKNGTYWYDPVEFQENIYYYSKYIIPIITEIKYKIRIHSIRLIQ